MVGMRRLWPDPASDELDDEALFACYEPPDRAEPCLRVNFVTSLDGAVTVDGLSGGLSSPADKRVFGVLRGICDALLVAAGTVRREGYGAVKLDEARRARRVARGLPPVPPLVVVSSRLDLPPDHPVFADAPVRPMVLTHEGAPPDAVARLREVADVLTCGEKQVDLRAGLAELNARGYLQVLCEGGPMLFGALTAADLVDELCLTVAPLLAGAGPGRIVGGDLHHASRRLHLNHVLSEGDPLLLRYSRRAGIEPLSAASA